jgi:hypothetical protein
MQLDRNGWESGRKFFKSLDDKQIDIVVKRIVEYIPLLEERKIFQPFYLLYYLLKI